MSRKIIYLLITCLLFGCSYELETLRPINEGSMHVKESLSSNTLYHLEGMWYFWPDQLLTSDEVDKNIASESSEYVRLPGNWSKISPFQNRDELLTKGTIALKVKIEGTSKQWAVRLPNASSATTLFYNGEKITEIGKSGEYAEEYIPSNRLVVTEIVPTGGEDLLVIHVSNFGKPTTGIWSSPTIGLMENINSKRFTDIVVSSLISGALIFMGLYHLVLFFVRREDRTTLYFGIICIFMAVRNLITGERIIHEFMPVTWESWRIAYIIEYLSAHMCLPLFFIYFGSLFKGYINKKVTYIVYAGSGIWLLMQLITPIMFNHRFLSFFEIFLLLSALYLFTKIIIAFIHKVNGANITILGMVILLGTVVNDVLLSHKIINGIYLTPLGVFFYTFSQSFLLSVRFSGLFKQVENYSEELQDLNHSLQRFIPKEVLSQLNKESIINVELGDHIEKVMTIVFIDIRNFTTMSETMSPNDNFRFLNSYLMRIGPVIRQHGGFVDKYVGDGIMALFPGDSDDAISASLEISSTLKKLNYHRVAWGYLPIKIGVGINTGTLMLGTIGENMRMDSTVISDAVNTASRLEESTKKYKKEILISENTVKSLKDPDRFNLTFIGTTALKGKSKDVKFYTVE